jgi:hypothetical protein
MFDVTFPDGIRRGMAFDSPTHPKVFVTKNGSTISKKDWKRLKLLAADDLPDSIRAPHLPTASDAEHRVEMLRHYLRGRGLDEESCDQACELARREMEEEEPVEDELVHAGPGAMGGRLNPATRREPDEKLFKSPAQFSERTPLGTTAGENRGSSVLSQVEYRSSPASDAMRVKIGTPGNSQFDPAPPLTAKDRRMAEDAAARPRKGLRKMFPGIEDIGIGDFPRRR